MDPLAAAYAKARQEREATGQLTEMERILRLGTEDLVHQAEELAKKWTENLRRHPKAPPLRPVQGLTLEVAHRQHVEYDERGLLGSIAVGGGKTLLLLLLPEVYQAERAAYLFPPKLRSTIQEERWKWARHYHIRDPEYIPYSTLSRPESTDLLRRLEPGMLMCDEVQALRNFTAARTKRVVRYMQSNPHVRFSGVTGTLMKDSIKDYAHLAELCLREGSPLPQDRTTLNHWASVVDPDGEPAPLDITEMEPLVEAFGDDIPYDDPQDRIRRAFYRRLRSTPGVVMTTKSSSDARLEVRGLSFSTPQVLRDALTKLANEYELPNGDLLDFAIHTDRALQQLCMGYYYIWDWPGEPDLEWLEARSWWGREVRRYLRDYAAEGRDSPKLVEEYIRAGNHQATDMADALKAWDAQRHKEPPPVKAIWLDHTPLMQALAWAHQQPEDVLLWFRTRAVAQGLRELGVPTLFGETPKRGVKIQALSTRVYHKGWNLQDGWHNQLVLEPSASPIIWEQLLGRTHRQGQKAELVKCAVFQHLWPVRRKMQVALDKARVIQLTKGQPQKLLNCDIHNVGQEG